MAHRKKHHHSVSLGNSFLNRARFIFLLSFLSVILILGLAVYNSNKTGALKKNLIEPIKKAAVSFVENINEESAIPIPTPFLDRSTTTNTVIINSKTTIVTPTPQEENYYYESSYQSYYQSSYAPSKTFEELVAEQNKWAEEKRAENEKWFQEQSSKNAAESKAKYNAAVEQMNAEYQANVQKAKEEQEAWKKEHGF